MDQPVNFYATANDDHPRCNGNARLRATSCTNAHGGRGVTIGTADDTSHRYSSLTPMVMVNSTNIGGQMSSEWQQEREYTEMFGYFSSSLVHRTGTGYRAERRRTQIAREMLWKVYALSLIAINAYVLHYTVKVTREYNREFGILHAFTVTAIITGMKPLVNIVNMCAFFVLVGRHRHLLRQMNRIGDDFASTFNSAPNCRRVNAQFITAIAATGFVIFPLRLFEFIQTGTEFGASFLVDSSIILVPLLSIWGLIPLFYFLLVYGMVGYYCRQLIKQLRARTIESLVKHHGGVCKRPPLSTMYRKFMNVCELQESASNLFGPWILWSFGWALFTLCLTIYFATQATSYVKLPRRLLLLMSPEMIAQVRVMLYFNVGWSILQIAIAFCYIIVICYVGTTINEGTRLIMKSVLANLPEQESDSERFKVTCFMYKLQTQYMWGVTVWRAFPIERSVFFTLCSLIMTYAVLLMKFRNGNDDSVDIAASTVDSATAAYSNIAAKNDNISLVDNANLTSIFM